MEPCCPFAEPPGRRPRKVGRVEFAAGRMFAWVDDEITDVDRLWVSTHHRGQALLHGIDSTLASPIPISPYWVNGWRALGRMVIEAVVGRRDTHS